MLKANRRAGCVFSHDPIAMRLTPKGPSNLLVSTALVALLASGLVGCKTNKGPEVTGSIGNPPPPPTTEAEWRSALSRYESAYKEKPDDIATAIPYAQALRATGQRTQAVAVLEQAAIKNPKDKVLLGAYGRALAETGKYAQALEVFSRAHSPEMPDWRILSAQGAVLDQLGRYDEARRYYASALKIVPDEPSVLSNLGLSYALSKDLKKAEETLRRATKQANAAPRARQNLALVVGLQGRFDEAETIARADLPPEEAAANVGYLRQMLAQQKNNTQASPKQKRAASTPAPRS